MDDLRDPNPADGRLLVASKEGREDEALAALEKIDDPWIPRSPHGETALHWAAMNGDVRLLRALLAKGVPPSTMNFCGTGPLHYAASKDRAEACEILLAAGADPRQISGFSGEAAERSASDKALASVLQAARLRVETAIVAVPQLQHVYRSWKWGYDTLSRWLLESSPSRPSKLGVEWGEGWVLREGFFPREGLGVPAISLRLAADWARILEYIRAHGTPKAAELRPSRLCGYCAAEGDEKKRCGRCRKVWFCGRECQTAAWELHKTLGCRAADPPRR